jgi:hypothetical protein
MGLPACQERILSGIENALRQGEPRLASRFAIFTRLASGEELPRTEQLIPEPWPQRWLKNARLRALLTVPAALIALAAALIFASISGGRPCPVAARTTATAQTRWDSCTASGAGGAATHGIRTGGAAAQGTPR